MNRIDTFPSFYKFSMRIERRHASRGSAIYLPRLSMLMFPNWGQTARVTRIQLTTPPSNSSVKLSSPLLNLCLPSTARAYRFSRVGVFPHSLAFSLSQFFSYCFLIGKNLISRLIKIKLIFILLPKRSHRVRK